MPANDPSVWELLGRQIDDGFARQDRRMDELLAEQKLTATRVKDTEITVAVQQTLVAAAAARIEVVAKRSHESANLLQTLQARLENFIAGGATQTFRRWLGRELTLVLSTVAAVIAVLKFLHLLG